MKCSVIHTHNTLTYPSDKETCAKVIVSHQMWENVAHEKIFNKTHASGPLAKLNKPQTINAEVWREKKQLRTRLVWELFAVTIYRTAFAVGP